MNAKDFLNQAYLLDQQIKSKSEQIQSLNELATSCTATMTGMLTDLDGEYLMTAVRRMVREEVAA